MMVNKRRLKGLKRLTILITIIIILFTFIRRTISRYQSDTYVTKELDIAFFAMDSSYQDQSISLEAIEPGVTYIVNFYVANYKDIKDKITQIPKRHVSEVSIQFDIIVTVTTNMPIMYAIELDGERAFIDEEIRQDEYGTYTKIISAYAYNNPKYKFYPGNEKLLNFKLIAEYPNEYREGMRPEYSETEFDDAAYSDLIDNINIAVNARQEILESSPSAVEL